jgi:Protein of unknown function (DUF2510)
VRRVAGQEAALVLIRAHPDRHPNHNRRQQSLVQERIGRNGSKADNSIMDDLGQAAIVFWPVIVFWVFLTAASGRIAYQKNLPISVGLLLGALLGLIGLIIVACLPANPRTAPRGPPPGWYPDPAGSGSSRYWNGQAWV